MDEVQKEYERIKAVFADCDPNKLTLVDGLLRQAAEVRVEIEQIRSVVKNAGGRIKCNPNNPSQQRVLPAAKELDKLVPSYTAIISRLCSILDKSGVEEYDDALDEFM